MVNIAIFASGNGSNFQSIVDSYKQNKLFVNKIILITNRKNCYASQRAIDNNIKNYNFLLSNYKDKREYEESILKVLQKENISYIFLAGYMTMITDILINKFKNKIINIHPSLLPSFKGKDAVRDALNYKVYLTGFTIHYVNEEMDSGQIIFQKEVKVYKNDNIDTLRLRIQEQEHIYYWKIINKIIKGEEV
ncbi:phosphoribosylglycinamide formyltransferase [Spiroplasma turonicum]|uniref:Phosphoribosylglycinamide formyltransferase n=1 Tax=Spiroplasma turonicum TaxID=216946 RepID=A0A0K1P8K1_9MOLU|nr:phosphoribosylglycinamide formyltransferase [Spiroplasma turonicum]AKU80232.1 methionyl-tRNA formyltransferase [Spiroplasma turonicum]ALX71232.1 phosphoribosylglycinamide formyltransferase 1 [Spiroplasma turonicum]